MAKYAETTTVSPEKSLMEIKSMLSRYGATRFAMLEDEQRFGIAFEMQGRRVRFFVLMPNREECKKAPRRYAVPVFSQVVYDQAVRQRWRALLLVVKAKLESVESGIEQFEDAFMSQIVLPSGEVMGEWAKPQIAAAYLNQQMPPMLGSG